MDEKSVTRPVGIAFCDPRLLFLAEHASINIANFSGLICSSMPSVAWNGVATAFFVNCDLESSPDVRRTSNDADIHASAELNNIALSTFVIRKMRDHDAVEESSRQHERGRRCNKGTESIDDALKIGNRSCYNS